MSEAYNVIPEVDYIDICEAAREGNGETAIYKSGEVAPAIRRIPKQKPETQAIAKPKTTEYNIVPEPGNAFSGVKVLAIPYVETDNPAGGKTATIG